MTQFFIDDTRQRRFRYDLSALIEFNGDMYDEFTSYFLAELRKLPSRRSYVIKAGQAYRPDIYSNDIFGTTDYWLILLYYNDILLIKDLTELRTLNVPSQTDLENLFFSLNARRRAAEASAT